MEQVLTLGLRVLVISDLHGQHFKTGPRHPESTDSSPVNPGAATLDFDQDANAGRFGAGQPQGHQVGRPRRLPSPPQASRNQAARTSEGASSSTSSSWASTRCSGP